jgi:hypothetical protein
MAGTLVSWGSPRVLVDAAVIDRGVELAMGYEVAGIDPSPTAVIVVDMENDFVAEGGRCRPRALKARPRSSGAL